MQRGHWEVYPIEPRKKARKQRKLHSLPRMTPLKFLCSTEVKELYEYNNYMYHLELREVCKASYPTRFKVPSSICYHLRVIPLSYVYRNLLHLLYNISWSLLQYYFLFQENPKGNIFSTNVNKGFQLALISLNELNTDYLIKWHDVVFIMTSLNKFWWILTHCGNLSWLVVIDSHSRVTHVYF